MEFHISVILRLSFCPSCGYCAAASELIKHQPSCRMFATYFGEKISLTPTQPPSRIKKKHPSDVPRCHFSSSISQRFF
ncbi:hypothetical protein BZA77DRAFT_303622 [Pyronema omphalodes]|nr:hypothetical protein BZA77DRAFT_303622 [Pyronema omphalodes]